MAKAESSGLEPLLDRVDLTCWMLINVRKRSISNATNGVDMFGPLADRP
jgi:hypothetical protein